MHIAHHLLLPDVSPFSCCFLLPDTYGLDEIEAIGFEKGVEQGIERGVEQGCQRVNHLHAALIKDNRTAELFQSTQDPELQEKLMEEYGIK